MSVGVVFVRVVLYCLTLLMSSWILSACVVSPACATDKINNVEYDGVSREKVIVPMVFPVVGKASWSDTFLAPRDGGKRRHHGIDVMARKMTPIVAVFDGTVYPRKTAVHNTLTLVGNDSWTASYMHINNDTPGTDDGVCSDKYAFAPGLKSGCQVRAGEILAYVGDSGNAEGTAPHLHFELCRGEPFKIVNPAASLKQAKRQNSASVWKLSPNNFPEISQIRVAYGIFNFFISKSDIFIEGTVIGVDNEAGRIVISAESIALADGKKITLNPARRKVIAISSDTCYYWCDTLKVTPKFEDIRACQQISVFGPNLGVGSVLPACYIILAKDGVNLNSAAAAQ